MGDLHADEHDIGDLDGVFRTAACGGFAASFDRLGKSSRSRRHVAPDGNISAASFFGALSRPDRGRQPRPSGRVVPADGIWRLGEVGKFGLGYTKMKGIVRRLVLLLTTTGAVN